jgi:hypothetical protein
MTDEGSEKEIIKKKRNTNTVKCGCPATMRVRKQASGLWKVVNFNSAHNHNMVTPAKRMCMPVCKNLPTAAKMLIDSFRDEGIPVNKVANILDGPQNGFFDKDCWNHLGPSKEYKKPVKGDATTVLNFFKKKSIKDPNLFYAI